MRLDKLRLLQAPGIRQGFTLEPRPGINLVTGPNGIGKSSICRAVRALLWPADHGIETLEVEAEFTNEGSTLIVSRQDLDEPVWQGARPDLGPDHLAGRYELGVLDLLIADRGDDLLAREIRRHLAGGFDLEQIRAQLFGLSRGRSESSDLKKAKTAVAQLQAGQQLLSADQDRLIELESSLVQASRAKDRQRILEALRDLAEQKAALEDAQARLDNIPPGVEHVRQDDPENLARFRKQEKSIVTEIEDRAAALDNTVRELEGLAKSGIDPENLPLELLKKKLSTLTSREHEVRTAEPAAQTLHQDEVLAKASVQPAVWPVAAALLAGAALMIAGIEGLLPGPIPPLLPVAIGGVFCGYGFRALYAYVARRKTSRIALDKRRELAAKKDHLEACRQQRVDALEAFNAELKKVGVAAVADADEADHRVEQLRQDSQRLITLRSERARVTNLLDREKEDLGRVRRDLQEIFDRLMVKAGPHADAEVSPLLELKPGLEKAQQDLRDAERDIARLETEVTAGRELLAADESAATPAGVLTGLIEKEKERAAGLEGVQKEITRINFNLDQALGGHDLQDALAAVGAARHQLDEVRQSNREAALGRLLLKRVEDQHQKESRPEVLEKADEYFQLFTGGRYELEMASSPEGVGRFRAIGEDSVKHLELDQLSDGTRTQLLLAVKLAFITAGEKGARPPIFLDDSLSSADPERFAAVVNSLARLVEEQGRQIFYLTPNPADAAAFNRALAQAHRKPAHHIDLGEVRDHHLAVDPDLLDPANLPADLTAPDPAGMNASEYAEAVPVPRPDPWAPAGAIHVFYLLEDDLDLVRRLIDARTPTLNRFEKREAALSAAGMITAGEAAVLGARGRLWKAWLDGWRIGRAQPVSREFLQSSAAVSDKFLQPVVEALEKCGGDGSLLLEAIEAKQVKGFRAAKTEQLQQELKDAGLLAHGRLLDDLELADFIDDRVQSLLAANLLDVQKVRTLALTFARIIENQRRTSPRSS